MNAFNAVGAIVAALILVKWGAQIWLERLNLKHVRAHAGAMPEGFRGVIDEPTYRKSVEYTLAKGKFDLLDTPHTTGILLVFLLSAVLPRPFRFLPHCLC